MSKKPKPQDFPPSQWDPDDFKDMAARSIRKEHRRSVRKNNKQNLRDAILDPEALEEYMDDLE